MKHIFSIIALFVCVLAMAETPDTYHTNPYGIDSVPATYFNKWQHQGELIYYLEGFDDHTVVETHTVGNWTHPERLTFSIDGSSCYSTRFYIDGFRTDDRFQPGSSQYVPNMQHHNLMIDTHSAQLYFERDMSSRDYAEVSYNISGINGVDPAPGTAAMIHIFHRTPVESADCYKHITARRHLKGAGTMDVGFSLQSKDGDKYHQHIYATYGERSITRQDQCGLILSDPLYDASYYKVQADGRLPLSSQKDFRSLNYRMSFAGRTDAGSEYLYNHDEVYDLKNYTGSLYAKFGNGNYDLTTGLTWATNVTRHSDLGFARNVIDQDGESFYPWMPDGKTHELGWALNHKQRLLDWLDFEIDAYNSFFYFTPDQQQWSNELYFQSPVMTAPAAMYRYEWQSQAYASGLLENTFRLQAHHDLGEKASMQANIDFTLDGMLLHKKSKISPNWQAGLQFNIHPCKWFEMGFNFINNRQAYNADYLRFMSDDYMQGKIYFSGTDVLFSTTGGAYHQYKKHLQQTQYFEFDMPIRFIVAGKHEFVFLQNVRKYYNVWHVNYAAPLEEVGYYQQVMHEGATPNVFYQNPGEVQYEVGVTPDLGRHFFNRTPHYLMQQSRYTYTGRKVQFSLSWQSFLGGGYTALGNGANSNTNGILSESTATPNTKNTVFRSRTGNYPGAGRLDCDKGFAFRCYVAYNICKYVQAGVTLKWIDGKPFASHRYFFNNGIAAQEANTTLSQIAILPTYTRGTNTDDLDFGTRNCAYWNIDLHVQGQWEVKGIPMTLNLKCYNLWDFSCDLAEYNFFQDIPEALRSSCIFNVPTGLLATFKVEW